MITIRDAIEYLTAVMEDGCTADAVTLNMTHDGDTCLTHDEDWDTSHFGIPWVNPK